MKQQKTCSWNAADGPGQAQQRGQTFFLGVGGKQRGEAGVWEMGVLYFSRLGAAIDENGPLQLNPPQTYPLHNQQTSHVTLLFPVDPKLPGSVVSVGRVKGR